MIVVYFRFDRWEVVRVYGYRETLLAFRPTYLEALQVARDYKEVERKG